MNKGYIANFYLKGKNSQKKKSKPEADLEISKKYQRDKDHTKIT